MGMTLSFSSFIKRKSVLIILALCITTFSVLVYLYNGQEEKSINSLLKIVFDCPNSDIMEIINESTDDYTEKLEKIYGSYFTESAYNDFVRMRVPSEYNIICQEKGYTIKMQEIQITKDMTSSRKSYTFNAKLKLYNNGNETYVSENGYIGFSEDYPNKIDYFWVSDALLNQLYKS